MSLEFLFDSFRTLKNTLSIFRSLSGNIFPLSIEHAWFLFTPTAALIKPLTNETTVNNVDLMRSSSTIEISVTHWRIVVVEGYRFLSLVVLSMKKVWRIQLNCLAMAEHDGTFYSVAVSAIIIKRTSESVLTSEITCTVDLWKNRIVNCDVSCLRCIV